MDPDDLIDNETPAADPTMRSANPGVTAPYRCPHHDSARATFDTSSVAGCGMGTTVTVFGYAGAVRSFRSEQ